MNSQYNFLKDLIKKAATESEVNRVIGIACNSMNITNAQFNKLAEMGMKRKNEIRILEVN